MDRTETDSQKTDKYKLTSNGVFLTRDVGQVDSDGDRFVDDFLRTYDLNGIDQISFFGNGEGNELFAQIMVQNTANQLVLMERT